jgi:hypothetical protein
MLSYCCASSDLSRFGACSAALRGVARHDQLWRLAWQCHGLPRQVPETQAPDLPGPGDGGVSLGKWWTFTGKKGEK